MDSRTQYLTVPGEESPSVRTYSDRESTAARDIEMLPLAPAPEASADNNKIYDSDVTSLIGTLVSVATSDPPDSHPQEQEAAPVLEPLHATPSNRPSTYNRLVLDTWICESVAIIFSIGCVVAIVITVGSFEGEHIPELPSGVTLNAMISVLSTAARAALIFVVSAAIGQLKWCWFLRSGRRLQDLQTMDEASRGPLGAFWILATWTGGSLASLGAFITICMIAFGPFFQQLVQYPTRNVEQGNLTAMASRNLNYTTCDYETLNGVVAAGLVFRSEVLNQGPTCPTAQCSWGEYTSVGWCSKCRRIDGYLNSSECNVKARLDQLTWDVPFCELWTQSNDGPAKLDREQLMVLGNSTYIDDPDAPPIFNILKVSTELLYPVLTHKDFVADDGSVIPHPLSTYRHATFSRDEQVLQNLAHSDRSPLRLDQLSECVLTFCEREYTAKTTEGNTSSTLTSTDYGNFTSLDEFSLERIPTNTPVPSRLSCWHPGRASRNIALTSFDEGLTYQNESKRVFCSDEFTRYASSLDYHISKHTNASWYFNGTHGSVDRTEFRPSARKQDSSPLDNWRVSANLSSMLEGIQPL